MDADLFLQQFGHLAQGEGGIKKLRDVILRLAVQGRLVKQNATEESAEFLLKRMNIQKSKKALETPVPFAIPASWRWVKLSEIAVLQIGKTPSRKETTYWSESKYPWVSIADLKHLSTITSTKEGITELAAQDCFNSRISPKGTLVMSFKLTIGKTSFLGMDAYHNEAIISIFPKINDLKIFMFWALSGLDLTTEQSNAIKGNTLNREKLENLDFPLPPLVEQKRIVEKVDELMVLCDKLEAEQENCRRLKIQSVQSTLHHLTRAENPTSFGTSLNILERTFGNWFDDLPTVKHLRATILELAAQGKLVPQNPTDEPASALLKRIEIEKKRLAKGGKVKKSSFSKPDNNDVCLPKGWTFVKWRDLGRICGGGTPSKGRSDYWNGGVCWISPKDMKSDYIASSELTITQKAVAETSVHPIPEGSILIVARSGILKRMLPVAINTVPCTVNQDIKVLVPYLREINRYLMLMLRGHEAFILKSLVKGGMTVQSLLYDEFAAHSFPLPPLAEQKRIVAKVDELMTLCDQLEAHITHTQTINTHLMDSLIYRMTEAA